MQHLRDAGSPKLAQLFLSQESVKGIWAVLSGTEENPI